MIKLEIDAIKVELKKRARECQNLERKMLRRSISAAYEAAWKIFKADYPFINKNSRQGSSRSFRDRTKSFLSLNSSPMFGEFKAEMSKVSALHAVRGEKTPYQQKGIPIRKRKPVRMSYVIRQDPSAMFIAKVRKKNTFLFANTKGQQMKKQVLPSVAENIRQQIGVIDEAANQAMSKTLDEAGAK